MSAYVYICAGDSSNAEHEILNCTEPCFLVSLGCGAIHSAGSEQEKADSGNSFETADTVTDTDTADEHKYIEQHGSVTLLGSQSIPPHLQNHGNI